MSLVQISVPVLTLGNADHRSFSVHASALAQPGLAIGRFGLITLTPLLAKAYLYGQYYWADHLKVVEIDRVAKQVVVIQNNQRYTEQLAQDTTLSLQRKLQLAAAGGLILRIGYPF